MAELSRPGTLVPKAKQVKMSHFSSVKIVPKWSNYGAPLTFKNDPK